VTVEPFPVVRVAHVAERESTPAWLVEHLWGEAAVGFVGGTPKSCKTWLSLELAVAVASGRPCLGRFRVRRPGHVLLYAAEDSAGAVRHRVAGIARARGVDLQRLAVGLIDEPGLRLDLHAHCERLDATVRKIRPRLLVLDPLVRLHRGDENSAGDTSMLLGFLRQLQREYGVAIVLVHHVRKTPAGQPGQALRGSGDLHAWADSNLFLLRKKGRLELHAEHRGHPAPEPVVVELDKQELHLRVVEHTEREAKPENPLAERVVALLKTRARTRTDLRQELRVRNETLGEVLLRLEADGRVTRLNGLLTVPRSGP